MEQQGEEQVEEQHDVEQQCEEVQVEGLKGAGTVLLIDFWPYHI